MKEWLKCVILTTLGFAGIFLLVWGMAALTTYLVSLGLPPELALMVAICPVAGLILGTILYF